VKGFSSIADSFITAFGLSAAATVALRQTTNRHVRVVFVADSLGLVVSWLGSGDQADAKDAKA